MLLVRILIVTVAVLVIAGVLWDAFETVVLPRRVSRRFRLARIYTRGTWRAWSSLARRIPTLERREAILAIYGPLALLVLLALWVFLLILGYALLLWGLSTPLSVTGGAAPGFGTDLYFSGTTFLTLGLGDVIPHAGPARSIVVIEVGTGFGMLALVIGYLPVLYQAFSRREMRISLLDAHAGSPPTAGALLLRHPPNRRARRLTGILAEWENWSAELLETHLSYPLLAFYRSQHEDQSWVAALAMILDACALVLACGRGAAGKEEEELAEQAAVTLAMARHAAIDLAQVFQSKNPKVVVSDGRLPSDERVRLQTLLASVRGSSDVEKNSMVVDHLDELRKLYEPYLEGLAKVLLMPLPPWIPAPGTLDDWQTTADGVTAPSVAALVSHRETSSSGHAD
jgi:ion channel